MNQTVTDPPALILCRSHLLTFLPGRNFFIHLLNIQSRVSALECSRVLLTITCTKSDILNVFPISPLGEQQSKPPPEGGLQPPCASSQFLQLLRMRSHTTKRNKNICGEWGRKFLHEFLQFVFFSHIYLYTESGKTQQNFLKFHFKLKCYEFPNLKIKKTFHYYFKKSLGKSLATY